MYYWEDISNPLPLPLTFFAKNIWGEVTIWFYRISIKYIFVFSMSVWYLEYDWNMIGIFLDIYQWYWMYCWWDISNPFPLPLTFLLKNIWGEVTIWF